MTENDSKLNSKQKTDDGNLPRKDSANHKLN